MSKTNDRKRKWARILKAQASDSAGITAGRVQLPAHESRTHCKAGKHAVRAMRNQSYESNGSKVFSQSQGGWVHAPTWYKKP